MDFLEVVRRRRTTNGPFLPDPIKPEHQRLLVEVAGMAPSHFNSQPWRFVKVQSPERRRAVWESFAKANERALAGYEGEQKAGYVSLKLAGLKEAPIHLAVFSDESTATGSGLGRQTMPETLRYSVVAAVQTLWLAARAEGVAQTFDPQTRGRDGLGEVGFGKRARHGVGESPGRRMNSRYGAARARSTRAAARHHGSGEPCPIGRASGGDCRR